MPLSSPKQFLLFVSLFIVFLVSGCGSDSKSQDASQSGVQLPPEIAQLRLADNGGIHAYVQVDDGQKMPMAIDSGTAILQLDLSVGSHKITISFEFVQSSDPAKSVLLAEASKTITVNSSGNSPLNFLTTDFNFSAHDDDDDGFSNLSEMQSGSSAPDVESVTPANGSVDATTDTLIAVSFDDPINPKKLTDSVAVVGSQNGAVAGSVSYDKPTHSVIFTPTNGLIDGEIYTVSIDTSVENTAGISLATMISWSFTVNDKAPAPSVLSVSPTDGSVDVAIDTTIEATFDSSMDESTLSSGFTVTGTSGAVSGSTSYDSSSLTATFTPSQPLNYNESYTATLGTAIQNTSGIALTTAASWGFTTIGANSYTVGGTVSGLAGSGLVLQNNAGDDMSISANGSFAFASALVDGSDYSVTVAAQPSTPNQMCAVSNGSGTLDGSSVSNVSVVCTTNTYTIGGTVSGLSGNGLVLQNNNGDDLAISADGSFTFSSALADGSDFSVTVATQPSTPNQVCSVNNARGTLAGSNVSSASVICSTNSYTVGGTVSGLTGSGLVLQNKAGDDLTISANGGFTFASALADGSDFSVTVAIQPSTPNQMCAVTKGSGTLDGSNVSNVTVVCSTNSYTVGGTVSGLTGSGLVLQNNAGDDLTVSANGGFTFASALADGSDFSVTVATQPSTPNQMCAVTKGSGTLDGSNVSNVSVVCTTNSYTVGGTVSGLTGSGLVLQNNNGDDLAITADGSFTFSSALADGSDFSVTVATQPSTPNQMCAVTKGSGTLDGSNVSNVSVVCTTNTYTIGGTVSGLSGNGLVLQNNNGDDLAISADGSFIFSTALADSSDFSVTVAIQPSTPNQMCAVNKGSGTLAGTNVSNVSVVCVTNTYTIGGTISALSGSGLVLQNNVGDDLTISANGSFTFATALADGVDYSVTVATQPSTPDQVCSVNNGSGTLSGNNVTNISVNCVNSYSIGGNVTGVLGQGLILQNNEGDDLTITGEGSFTFPEKLSESSNYRVSIVSQPTSPNQECNVSNDSGVLAGNNVTDVSINCITNTYTISGNVTGLLGSGLELQNNGGDNLSIASDGSFTFPTALDDSTAYNVKVLNQPGTPAQSCYVNNGSATLAGANVADINVICPHPAPDNFRVFSGFEGQNILSWDAVPDATQYILYWNTRGGVSSSDNAINIPVSTSYSHANLTDGKKYYYRLAVQTSVSDSLLTDEVSSTTGTLKWVNPKPSAKIYYTDIAWNGTTYIATSNNGIYSSSDLANWTLVLSGQYKGIIWSDSQNVFVAVGKSGVYTSQKGTEWNFQNSGVSSTLNSVAWLGDQYLAVGDAGTIITSPDTVNWTIQPTNYTNTTLNDISWNGTTYVAVGSNYTTSSDTILTSTDGTGWVSQKLSFSSSDIKSIAWTGTQFITVGSLQEETMSSIDGYTWAPLAGGPSSRNEIIWTGSQLVVVGGFSILTSPDGISWSGAGAPTGFYSTVRWLGDKIIALTREGGIVISPDGIDWSSANAVAISSIRSINWNGSQYVAVNADGEVLTSSDGITWSLAYSGSAYLWDVIWSGNKYVAVGSDITLTSPDGINWKEHPLSLTRYFKLTKVIWGNNQYLAVGDKGGIVTSPDGVNWTEQLSGVSIWLNDVTWNDSLSQPQYVAVGDITGTEGTILTSSDGVSWTIQASGVASDLLAITWSGSQYVATGQGKELISSSDGLNWTNGNYGSGFGYARDVVWVENKFITVGRSGASWFSYDGHNWFSNYMRTHPDYMYGLAWDGSKFVMVGSAGTILVK